MTDQWRVACPGISLSTSLKARGLPPKLEVSGAEQMDEYDIKILLVPFEKMPCKAYLFLHFVKG